MKLFTLAILAFTMASSVAKSEATSNIILTEENSVSFNQAVKGDYVAKKQLEIIQKSAKLHPSKPIYLILDTPGGSVIDGLLFIDTIKSLNRRVDTITIFAASMGYQIAQELNTRYILPSGTLMSHRGAISGLSGQVPGELNSRLGFYETVLERMNVNAAKRVGMSVEKYKASIINELWVNGSQAVSQGHADEVANVSCDKNLTSKTEEQKIVTMFGTVLLTYSKCPLISAPIDFKFGREVNSFQETLIRKSIKNNARKPNLTF